VILSECVVQSKIVGGSLGSARESGLIDIIPFHLLSVEQEHQSCVKTRVFLPRVHNIAALTRKLHCNISQPIPHLTLLNVFLIRPVSRVIDFDLLLVNSTFWFPDLFYTGHIAIPASMRGNTRLIRRSIAHADVPCFSRMGVLHPYLCQEFCCVHAF